MASAPLTKYEGERLGTSTMALLDLKHVSKAYPHSKGVLPVLEDISFTVEQGEFIAIVGPSGCGKSTLVRIVNGIVPPTSGQVLYR
jgi:NitT/TauT family transport system ATP-binding protein